MKSLLFFQMVISFRFVNVVVTAIIGGKTLIDKNEAFRPGQKKNKKFKVFSNRDFRNGKT